MGRTKEYFRTKLGRLTKIYSKMKERYNDNSKKNISNICSREDFIEFAKNNKEYEILYEVWARSNYDFKLTPSIDRIDCKKGYTLDNIQFLSKSENSKKSNVEYKRNLPKRQNKKSVRLYNEIDSLIFETCKDACDYLKLAPNAVTIAIKKKKKLKGYNCEYL